MAIKFVDVEPRKGEGAPPARRVRAPEAALEPLPTPEPAPTPEAPADGEAPLPGLTHAKPEPKPRGRKKPLSAAGSERPTAGEAATLLDGLVPVQAHAKPTPKPRGRKKAFG